MKEPTNEQLEKSASTIGLITFFLGVLFVIGGGRVTQNASILLYCLGFGFVLLGGVVLVYGKQFGEDYVAKKSLVEDVVEESLIQDRKGIIWVWVVAITTWAIMAVAYFSLSMVVYLVLDSVEGMYAFSEEAYGVITLTKNVTGWFLIIMTIGIIGWALINSARRETSTYPN